MPLFGTAVCGTIVRRTRARKSRIAVAGVYTNPEISKTRNRWHNFRWVMQNGMKYALNSRT